VQLLLGLAFLPSRHVKLARLIRGAEETGEALEAEEAEYAAPGGRAR
jgi:hypothetical protein